jgi:hypothetical protein
MAEWVLSELAGARGGVTLVIDDLHELNSLEALAQLTRLLMSLPPHVHAILTTRHDLRLRLYQLRLACELAEIRAANLRFPERALAGSPAGSVHRSVSPVGPARDGIPGHGPWSRRRARPHQKRHDDRSIPLCQ